MATRPVQISMDEDLLARIDADPEALRDGRSAFLRKAVSFYLAAKERRELDEAITTAYSGQADAMAAEIAEFMDAQGWPES
jgi:metal-responsive CopG/Arc/MetJ family transcriptional regulator